MTAGQRWRAAGWSGPNRPDCVAGQGPGRRAGLVLGLRSDRGLDGGYAPAVRGHPGPGWSSARPAGEGAPRAEKATT